MFGENGEIYARLWRAKRKVMAYLQVCINPQRNREVMDAEKTGTSNEVDLLPTKKMLDDLRRNLVKLKGHSVHRQVVCHRSRRMIR